MVQDSIRILRIKNNNAKEGWIVKPFKTYIVELFDKPLPYKRTVNKTDLKVYDFSIKMNGSSKKVETTFFDADGLNEFDVTFKVDNKINVTGLAGTAAIKIFTTVIAQIIDFIKAHQPNKIVFTAVKTKEEGQSRSKLYDRMTKRLTPKEYVLHIRQVLWDTESEYTFTKRIT
jgi:hypothetical protein